MLEVGESDFRSHWELRCSHDNPRILVVAGLGFDPRMNVGPRAILETAGRGRADVCLLTYSEGPSSPSQQYSSRVRENREILDGLVAHAGAQLHVRDLPLTEDDPSSVVQGGRKVGGFSAMRVAGDQNLLRPYTDIVVDVSALPRSLYFPYIHKLLRMHDKSPVGERIPRNLHVIGCENPNVDRAIREEPAERADYLPGFRKGSDNVQTRNLPRVWAPVLGENQEHVLKLIEQLIADAPHPPEICPVLPFPSDDPRRGDRLLLEYRELFERWRVELRNIIFASESNPFDVYRQLCRLDDDYAAALAPLNGARTVLSAHSSKLLSLGVLLAAYDRSLAVAHVEANGYTMDESTDLTDGGKLYEVWIAGDPYES